MLAEAKAQTRVAPVGERLDACLKFIERAKKRLESADQDVIEAQEARAVRDTELSEGLARFATVAFRSQVCCASSSSWRRCRCSTGDLKVKGHIALLDSGSTDTSLEVMRQKKARTLPRPPISRTWSARSWSISKKSQFQGIRVHVDPREIRL